MLSPLLITVSMLLSTVGSPDKFWLEATEPASEGSRPAVVEGVLLEEDATSYRIRVQGGEITLTKTQVTKVEKDGLTVEAIEERERAAKAAKEEAEVATEEVKAADASRTPAEATAEKSPPAANREGEAATPAEEEAIPARFDPVRGRFVPGTKSNPAPLRVLEASYEASGDRAVLKELRRKRRGK